MAGVLEQRPPWGNDSIYLELSGCVVAIDGLSGKQHQTIARDYKSFISVRTDAFSAPDVICRAGRLINPVALAHDHFVVNGQYTPRKRRNGEVIEITGFDSVTHLVSSRALPIQAALAVADEDDFSREFVLKNFLRTILAHYALERGGVLLHSGGVLHDDRAYLFCGRSNAGKTTLSRKAAEAGARVLSDDINLVLPENGGFRAHKVPFTGEFGCRMENVSGVGPYSLGGLALLGKTPVLTATPLRSAEAVAGLLTGCPFVNDDSEELPALLDILTRLVSHTPVVRLGLSLDDPFEVVMKSMLRCCEND